MNLFPWAIRHGISHAALAELALELGEGGVGTIPDKMKGDDESSASSAVRIEAAQKGLKLWRNNVGALLDERGVPVRYGLANDSKKINEVIKSADLIGIRPVTILPAHVGMVLGQFVSREMKAPGWSYSATPREEAQRRWALLIAANGGDAGFATGAGTL